MSVPKYETDVIRRVHDNGTGRNIEVKPDGDGLGLVEIDGGDDYGRITLPPEMALMVADAIGKCALETIRNTPAGGIGS